MLRNDDGSRFMSRNNPYGNINDAEQRTQILTSDFNDSRRSILDGQTSHSSGSDIGDTDFFFSSKPNYEFIAAEEIQRDSFFKKNNQSSSSLLHNKQNDRLYSSTKNSESPLFSYEYKNDIRHSSKTNKDKAGKTCAPQELSVSWNVCLEQESVRENNYYDLLPAVPTTIKKTILRSTTRDDTLPLDRRFNLSSQDDITTDISQSSKINSAASTHSFNSFNYWNPTDINSCDTIQDSVSLELLDSYPSSCYRRLGCSNIHSRIPTKPTYTMMSPITDVETDEIGVPTVNLGLLLEPIVLQKFFYTFQEELFDLWWGRILQLELFSCPMSHVVGVEISLRLLYSRESIYPEEHAHGLTSFGFVWLSDIITAISHYFQMYTVPNRSYTRGLSTFDDISSVHTFITTVPRYFNGFQILKIGTIYPSFLGITLVDLAKLVMLRKESIILMLQQQYHLVVIHAPYTPTFHLRLLDTQSNDIVSDIKHSSTSIYSTWKERCKHHPFSFKSEKNRHVAYKASCDTYNRSSKKPIAVEKNKTSSYMIDENVYEMMGLDQTFSFSVFEPSTIEHCNTESPHPKWSFFSSIQECDDFIAKRLCCQAKDTSHIASLQAILIVKNKHMLLDDLPNLSSLFVNCSKDSDTQCQTTEEVQKTQMMEFEKCPSRSLLLGLCTYFTNNGKRWYPFGLTGPAFKFHWILDNSATTGYIKNHLLTGCCPDKIYTSVTGISTDYIQQSKHHNITTKLCYILICRLEIGTSDTLKSCQNCVKLIIEQGLEPLCDQPFSRLLPSRVYPNVKQENMTKTVLSTNNECDNPYNPTIYSGHKSLSYLQNQKESAQFSFKSPQHARFKNLLSFFYKNS